MHGRIKYIYANNKKIRAFAKSTVLVTVLLITLIAVLKITGYGKIPELEQLDEIDADWYEVETVRYDSKTMEWIAHRGWSKEIVKADTEHVYKLMQSKGRKALYWNKNKITYPMYAVTITPRKFKSDYDGCGETFVLSDGYLITPLGNVYRCDLDMDYFLEADEHDFHRVAEVENIRDMSCFRPLSYADHKWNSDMLTPSYVTADMTAERIEAALIQLDDNEGSLIATIRLVNNGDTDWHFCDSSIFVRVEVKVDGKWYYFHKDPGLDLYYATFPTYNAVVGKGSEREVEFNLGMYGTLPKGDYRIVIGGNENEKYDYVCADMNIR